MRSDLVIREGAEHLEFQENPDDVIILAMSHVSLRLAQAGGPRPFGHISSLIRLIHLLLLYFQSCSQLRSTALSARLSSKTALHLTAENHGAG